VGHRFGYPQAMTDTEALEMDMSGEREKLIRDHWNKYARGFDFRKRPAWKVAVRRPWTNPPSPEEQLSLVMDTLEFRIESGTYDARPAYRIVCEGVELDRWFK
jgi:hypothetical protein